MPQTPPQARILPAAEWSVLSVTFLNSIGTGVVTNGIFFLTSSAYKFTQTQNYILGVVLGVTYIVGAMGTRRLLERVKKAGISSRGVLIGVMGLLAALCVIPLLAIRSGVTSSWPIWALVVIYSPLTGVLWPVIEGYVSGGRSGSALRGTMGRWNVVWSSAVVVSYWAMSPLIKSHAAETILALSLLHLGAGVLVARSFGAEPGEHPHEVHEPHPVVFTHLLVTHRIMLPLAYVVSSTLSPFLPDALSSLGVEQRYHGWIASMWLVPRVVTFFTLQVWQGWHGRWWLIILAMGLLFGGFASVVLSPLGVWIGLSPLVCIGILMTGLLVFGTGMATIYSGALYYAMEVGEEEVDSGGQHEALIGLGCTLGPVFGLIPTLAVNQGWLAPRAFHPVVLGTVALAIAIGIGMVLHRIRHSTRGSKTPHAGGRHE
jgi:hypothetical protein